MAKKTRQDPEYLLRDFFSQEIAEERARLDPKSRPSPSNLALSPPPEPLPSKRPRPWSRRARASEVCAAACILFLAILPFIAPPAPSNAALLMAASVAEGRPEALLLRLGELLAGSAHTYRASLRHFPGTARFNRFH